MISQIERLSKSGREITPRSTRPPLPALDLAHRSYGNRRARHDMAASGSLRLQASWNVSISIVLQVARDNSL